MVMNKRPVDGCGWRCKWPIMDNNKINDKGQKVVNVCAAGRKWMEEEMDGNYKRVDGWMWMAVQ